MAVNAYERPAEQRFIDTYAPLPFQEIMAVGQAYQRERERTEQDIEQFMAEHSKFTSPSAIDAANYEALTKGVLDPQFQRMRMDPEWLRSQEGQAAIRGAIRSVDTGKLGMLRQSSEFLQERARNRAKLIAAGKYKESWDELANLSEYDTLSQGVLSDLSPMEYVSLHDIATPYAENLEPSFLGRADRYYDWVGVDEKAIRQSLNTQFDSILSTPQGKAWYNDIVKEAAAAGVTDPNEVKEEMMNRLVQTQKDRIRIRKELNQANLTLDSANIRASRARAGSKEETPDPRYTDMLKTAANSFMASNVDYLGNNFPMRAEHVEQGERLATALNQAITSGNREHIGKINDAIAGLKFEVARDNIRSVFYAGANVENWWEDPKPRAISLSNKNAIDGFYNVMNTYSIENSKSGAEAILNTHASKKTKDGDFLYTNTNKFVTPREAVTGAGELGIKVKPGLLDYVLEEGALTNVKVKPASGDNVFVGVDKHGNTKTYQRVIISIDEDNISKEGLGRALDKWKPKKEGIPSRKFFRMVDGVAQFEDKPTTYTRSRSYESIATGMPETWKNQIMEGLVRENRGFVGTLEPKEVERISVNDEGEVSTGTTTTGKEKKVFSVEVLMPVEETYGNQVATARINQEYLQNERTRKDAGEMYAPEVDAAFSQYLRNMQSAADQDVINNMTK